MNTPAVIYARYSSSNQREESIAGQIRCCREYAERNGYQIMHEYTDSALTGRTDRRPGFQQMIRDSENQTFEAVIVYKLDRFARNRYDSAMYRNKLKKNGVRIISAMEAISDSPEGIILEGLMESLAEYYSANLSENVKRGMYESALDRKILSTPTFGYKRGSDGKYEIDEHAAAVVRQIFDWYISGKTQAEIITALNKAGHRTARGNKFNKNSLHFILTNEKYIGVYKYADIVDPHGIPPIIDRKTFETAQQIALDRKRYRRVRQPKKEEPYILSSLLFCGSCGSPMTGESAKSATGRIYRYYSCIGTKSQANNGCEKRRISKELLEHEVYRIVNEQVLTDTFIRQTAKEFIEFQKKKESDGEIGILESQLAEIKKKLSNIAIALESNPASETMLSLLADREEEKDRISARIQYLKANTIIYTEQMVIDHLNAVKRLAETDSSSQRAVIDEAVKRITLFDTDDPHIQRIVIELKFTGNSSDPLTLDTIVRLKDSLPCLSMQRRTIGESVLILSSVSTQK